MCDELKKNRDMKSFFRERTGLILDAYFSATKIKWMLDHVAGAKEKAQNGKILFGTVETWLIWKLTKGKVHVTDYSNAARTMLFNIHTLKWDEEILKLLDIPACILPEVVPSSGVCGKDGCCVFRRRNSHRRRCGRSAGGAFWSGLL